MAFTPEQIKSLQAPLDSRHVKQREQAGRKFDYVEGWHAIDEANRIFGHEAWDRETVSITCVSEGEYEKDEYRQGRRTGNKVKMYRCTYNARVRVTVRAGDVVVVREGCGSGHGSAQVPGDVHESAIKEAETDAMKRALMTFGNPFGLALYDKDKSNVSHGSPPAERGREQGRDRSPDQGNPSSPAGQGEGADSPAIQLHDPETGEVLSFTDPHKALDWIATGMKQHLGVWQVNEKTVEWLAEQRGDVSAQRKGSQVTIKARVQAMKEFVYAQA